MSGDDEKVDDELMIVIIMINQESEDEITFRDDVLNMIHDSLTTIMLGFFKADPARAFTRTDSVFLFLSKSVVHLDLIGYMQGMIYYY